MKHIPIDELRDVLSYEPETGLFRWKTVASYIVKVGGVAGSIEKKGYIAITYRGIRYKAHRLAFAFYYGREPAEQIDHINGLKSDNRIVNLREVSQRENQVNTPKHRSGRLPGAYLNSNRKWQAQATVNKKRYYLGQFDTEEKAHFRYMEFITAPFQSGAPQNPKIAPRK